MTPMQSIGMTAIAAVLVVPTPASAADQQSAPQIPPVAQAAVTGCAQAHPLAERTIEAANRRIEAARQANSAAAMRAAVDDLQAALRQLRTDIAPCAGLESLAPDPHAGHVTPATAQAPAAPASGAVADPHADHVTPASPQTPATGPRATPAQRPAGVPSTPATQPRSTPSSATAADPHAGHVMPAAPQAPASAAEGTAVQVRTTVANPAARLSDLMCQPQVDPDTAPRATYLGKAYYFCTAADQDLFLKAPAKYLQR